MQLSSRLSAIRIPFELPLPDGGVLERFVWSYVYGGSAVIDAGVRGFSKLLDRVLETDFPGSSGPELVLFTHAHPDHIGGGRCLMHSWPTCRSAAHADAAAWIEDPALQYSARPVPGFHEIVGGRVKVNRIIADGDTVACVAGAIRVIATPGHCAGHCAFMLESERVLIAGDAVPNPGAMPIYEDVGLSRASVARLLDEARRGADTLLSSWDDEVFRGEAVGKRLEAALGWIDATDSAVRAEAAASGRDRDPMAMAPGVAARLGLPAFAVNALFARTVKAHLELIDGPTRA